jgi:predicted nucleotidyltransferase
MNQPLNKKAIIQILIAQKQILLEFGVEQIGLFGSFLRHEENADSDIDFLVNLRKEKKTFKNFMALNYFLESLFNRKVELVTKQSPSPYIGPHILSTVEYVALAG